MEWAGTEIWDQTFVDPFYNADIVKLSEVFLQALELYVDKKLSNDGHSFSSGVITISHTQCLWFPKLRLIASFTNMEKGTSFSNIRFPNAHVILCKLTSFSSTRFLFHGRLSGCSKN